MLDTDNLRFGQTYDDFCRNLIRSLDETFIRTIPFAETEEGAIGGLIDLMLSNRKTFNLWTGLGLDDEAWENLLLEVDFWAFEDLADDLISAFRDYYLEVAY